MFARERTIFWGKKPCKKEKKKEEEKNVQETRVTTRWKRARGGLRADKWIIIFDGRLLKNVFTFYACTSTRSPGQQRGGDVFYKL